MQRIGVGLIGTGFMGKCHAMAYAEVKAVFGATPDVERALLCDVEAGHAHQKAHEFGFARSTTDWQELVKDPAVQLVSITAPNSSHKEMALAALAAGKHVWCEKPMALTLADAEEMAAAARKANGKVTALGYNYLRNPLVQFARHLIEAGEIGVPFDFRGSVDEDYQADPQGPWSWRMKTKDAGLGTLGDLTCHLVSIAHELMGPVAGICAMADIVYSKRPVPNEPGRMADVENEDIAHALVRFASGARGILASSRIAHGRKNGLKFEVHGAKGMLSLDSERPNEIQLYVAEGPRDTRGFRRILIAPQHPPFERFCPAPGHGLGFNELKVIELHEVLNAIQGKPSGIIDFEKGLTIERVIHAFVTSSASGRWVAP
jgi:predicted dehydrogenase